MGWQILVKLKWFKLLERRDVSKKEFKLPINSGIEYFKSLQIFWKSMKNLGDHSKMNDFSLYKFLEIFFFGKLKKEDDGIDWELSRKVLGNFVKSLFKDFA